MNDFQELPCTKQGLSNRKLIYNVGFTDVAYSVYFQSEQGEVMCPYFKVWKHMLDRCYDKKLHKRRPTYSNCTVSEEWLIFSNFKNWMIQQDWQDNELDKDLLYKGNKHYSKETCCFISPYLNTLLLTCKASRGKYKLGVTYKEKNKKYVAQCNVKDKPKHLGYFNTEDEAHTKYCKVKANYFLEIAEHQSDLRIKNALIHRANTIHLEE